MSRLILDHKVISTADAFTIAKFVFDLTNKGYEPLPLQCNRQFGNIVITMVLYEGENNEPTKESTGTESDTEASDSIGSKSGTGEATEQKELQDGAGSTEDKAESDGSQVDSKPKRVTRAKAKA